VPPASPSPPPPQPPLPEQPPPPPLEPPASPSPPPPQPPTNPPPPETSSELPPTTLLLPPEPSVPQPMPPEPPQPRPPALPPSLPPPAVAASTLPPAPTAAQPPAAPPLHPPPPRPPAPPYSWLPLSVDQRRRADELVTVFENSSLEPKYNFAADLGDGRGITFGRCRTTEAAAAAIPVAAPPVLGAMASHHLAPPVCKEAPSPDACLQSAGPGSPLEPATACGWSTSTCKPGL
jgi:hypothetical protein